MPLADMTGRPPSAFSLVNQPHTREPRSNSEYIAARMNLERTTPPAGESPAARLCTSCGMCCNGFFFGYVELKPGDDVAALEKLLPLETKDGKQIFKHPCSAHINCRCTIYALRPQICRGYRCRLLREVETHPDRLPLAQEKAAQLSASFAQLKACLRRAGFLSSDAAVPATIKTFRAAYGTALKAKDTAFLSQHREIILQWKRTAWLMAAFDEKAAGRLTLPTQASESVAPPPDKAS